MAFDTKRFLKAKLAPRTADVPVPDLASFFGEGEPAVWTVRGLTGQEIGRANEAAARNKLVASTLEAIAGMSATEQIAEIKQALGLAAGVPENIAKRIEYLTIGSVSPAITQEVAVRLCETFPIAFYDLTNKIQELTGQGAVERKKSTPSGGTPASGPA